MAILAHDSKGKESMKHSKNTNMLSQPSGESAIFQDKTILITGGTGSLGRKLVSRILTFEFGIPSKVIIFSRR